MRYKVSDFGLLDVKKQRFFNYGKPVPLQALQYKLLALMVVADGGIVGLEEIDQALWPNGDVDFANNRKVQIGNLRKILSGLTGRTTTITNVRSLGYRLALSVSVDAEHSHPFYNPGATEFRLLTERVRLSLLAGSVTVLVASTIALLSHSIGPGGFGFSYRVTVLSVAIFLTVFSWAALSRLEVDVLDRWMDPEDYRPPNPIVYLGLGVILAGLFGSMLAVAHRFQIASAIWFVYTCLDLIIAHLARGDIRRLAEGSRIRLQRCRRTHPSRIREITIYEDAIELLESYHTSRFRFWALRATALASLMVFIGAGILSPAPRLGSTVIVILALFATTESFVRFSNRESELISKYRELMRSPKRVA